MTRILTSGPRAGFTFVEAIVALLVAALLVNVAARSLATVFQADRSADSFLEAGLLLRRAAAGEYRGAPLEDLPEEWPAGWNLQPEVIRTGSGDESRQWKLTRCMLGGFSAAIAFSQEE